MKKLILLMCFLAYSGCGIKQESVSQPLLIDKDVVITKHYVEFGGMYDREYELTIRETGEVSLRGKFTATNPFIEERWNVPPDEVARMVETFRNNGFFEMGEKYGEQAIDGGEWSISIIIDDKEKKVKRLSWDKHTSEEKTLRNLELLINKTAEADSHLRKCCYFPDYPSEEIS